MAGWKSVEEIIAYQLSVQLRREVVTFTRTGPAAQDWDFRKQIRDSARSVASNLSEGFTRYNHGEFAYLANVAKSSLAETRTHLTDAKEEDYLSQEEFDRLDRIAEEAIRTTSGLIRHLKTTKAPRPYWDVAALGENPSRRRSKRPKPAKGVRRRHLRDDVDVEF